MVNRSTILGWITKNRFVVDVIDDINNDWKGTKIACSVTPFRISLKIFISFFIRFSNESKKNTNEPKHDETSRHKCFCVRQYSWKDLCNALCVICYEIWVCYDRRNVRDIFLKKCKQQWTTICVKRSQIQMVPLNGSEK